jgi:hypothetical protein
MLKMNRTKRGLLYWVPKKMRVRAYGTCYCAHRSHSHLSYLIDITGSIRDVILPLIKGKAFILRIFPLK